MAGTKEIKQRIKSVKNTKKITKAMELVSASKMKRAVSKVLASRTYASYSWELLTSLSEKMENVTSPFFAGHIDENSSNSKAKKRTLFVLITSNSGLCGAYNSQIIKKSISAFKQIDMDSVDIVTIGKKGDNAMRRTGSNVTASFVDLPDNSTMLDVMPLSKMIIDDFKVAKYEKVYIAYTDFVSVLTQRPKIRQILPITNEEIKELLDEIKEYKKEENKDTKKQEYIFEGDTDMIVELLAEKLVRMQIYHMILESSASEQSSRMMAMKNASEAAGEMIDDLTLVFNKARQASITQEISEISAGMASIE